MKLAEVKRIIDKLEHPDDLSDYGFKRYRTSNSGFRRIYMSDDWVIKFEDAKKTSEIGPHPKNPIHPKTPIVKTLEHKGFVIQPLLLDYQTAKKKHPVKANKIYKMAKRWRAFNESHYGEDDIDLHQDNFAMDSRGVVRAIDW